jgi:hypothetical protein
MGTRRQHHPRRRRADLFSIRHADDGTLEQLYQRSCNNQHQSVWVRQVAATELAHQALDHLVQRLLPPPQPILSPDPTVGGYVNLETWLAVTDPGPITATATIPGLQSTITATPTTVTWDMGTTDDPITCTGLGTTWTPPPPPHAPPPCGYTYHQPATTHPYTITTTITYTITWTATNGQTGNLGTTNGPTTTITYPVHEIQTIGRHG